MFAFILFLHSNLDQFLTFERKRIENIEDIEILRFLEFAKN